MDGDGILKKFMLNDFYYTEYPVKVFDMEKER